MSDDDQQYDYVLCSDAVNHSLSLHEQAQQHCEAVLKRYAGLKLHIDSEQDLMFNKITTRTQKSYRIARLPDAMNVSEAYRKRYLEKITLRNLFQHVNGAALLRFRNPKCYSYSVDLWKLTQQHCANTEKYALRCNGGFLVDDLPKPLTIMTILKYFCESSKYQQRLDYVYVLWFNSKLDYDDY